MENYTEGVLQTLSTGRKSKVRNPPPHFSKNHRSYIIYPQMMILAPRAHPSGTSYAASLMNGLRARILLPHASSTSGT